VPKCSYLESKLPHWEVLALLLCLFGDKALLVLGQSSSNGTGLLWSEIEREIFLFLVEETELMSVVRIDDCERSGNVLANGCAESSLMSASHHIAINQNL
jgi:hypothetical protein